MLTIILTAAVTAVLTSAWCVHRLRRTDESVSDAARRVISAGPRPTTPK